MRGFDMRTRGIITLLLFALMSSCSDKTPDKAVDHSEAEAPDSVASNPLLSKWDTPFGTPPFDTIRSEDYLPALRAGMQEQNAEIAVIVNNKGKPTFENTVEAYERSGQLLDDVDNVFSAVNGANSDDVTTETANIFAPENSAHGDDILLNADLFKRIDTVFVARESLDLNDEQMRLLEETHRDFLKSGVNLDGSGQAKLRAINSELASLSQTFRDNQLAETNDFELLITDVENLGDLPSSLKSLAAEEAKRRGHECECWSFTLQRPSINPFLQYSPSREDRKFLFDGYAMRGNNNNEHDNKLTLTRMAVLRAERASLMGLKNHAEFVLQDRMADNTDLIYELMDKVWQPAINAAKQERADRQAMMNAEGIPGKLEGWDWRYYTEKVRKANYEFDEEELRPYFEVNAVRDGVFELSNRLFGLTFKRREDLSGWHPDQQVFEVFDDDGSHLAILYMDFFARESKRGGAWMNALRVQSKLDGDVTPIVTNNFNFPAPTEDSPSLLSLGEAETLFHEFGHALHGMLSDVTYASLAGTATPRDFVEFPSQVMENWVREPEVLRMFAKHYLTGETIPDALIEKIGALATFDQGFKTIEYLAASYLDMAYHVLEGPAPVDALVLEETTMAKIGLIDEIIPRYRSTYFAHIFAGGYSAGYYSYLWSEILDADAFQAFKETSLLSKETAASYREHILSKGGTRPGMELYQNFRGRPPSIEPLLERRGFL
jgi:peptidyl-dipeptidase Dcp